MLNFKTLTQTGSGVALLIVALVALNIISSRLSTRVDVTEDKVYSLSAGTDKIIDSLTDDVDVRLYFSRSNKSLPVVFKTYATRVEEVLAEYAARSGGKINLEMIDPKPDTEEEEAARRYGITGARLPDGDQMYFGAVFLSGSKEVAVPYLDPRREEFLEYDLSEALVTLFRQEKPVIGILSSLDVLGGANVFGGGAEPWAFVQSLQKHYEVKRVDPQVVEVSPEHEALIVLHPKNLSEKTVYALDQFVMRGGRLVVAVDPMSRVDLSQGGHASRMSGRMPDASSDLPKLFGVWDLQYDKTNLVGDTRLATQINAGGQGVLYPYFVSLDETSLTQGSVMTGSLKTMLFAEGGALSLKEGSPFTFTPLIQTSENSGTASANLASMMAPADLAREIKTDGKKRILAGLLRGNFKSAFAGPPQGLSDEDKQKLTQPHQSIMAGEGSIVVVADTDFLFDGNAVDKMRFANQVMIRMRNDNLHFLTNAVDVLAGSPDLIAIRSSGKVSRPFTRVQELQRQAQAKWKKQEEELTAQLESLQKELNELQKQRTDGNLFMLSQEQQDKIKRFRDEEQQVRRKRREVRKNLREDIEDLGKRLIAANMLVLPLAVSGFGFGVFVNRSRRMRRGRKNGQ